MNSEHEYGRCEVCGEEGVLQRTYYEYPIKCECHSPRHFEIVRHHKDCVPKEPKEMKVTLKTEDFKKIISITNFTNLLESASEEIQNLYGRDTELTIKINKILEEINNE